MIGKTVIDNGIVQTLCRQCAMRCGIDVYIQNGIMKKITGSKKHPQNRGRICPKAVSAIDLAYHPDRLLKPLKRDRNGDFVEISYAQAMDEIAEKIQDIKKNYGAQSMGVWTGEAIGSYQQAGYASRFIHAFGSSSSLSNGSVCYIARDMAYRLVQGRFNFGSMDFPNARAILLWGANLGITQPPDMWRIEEGQRNGAKLVVIDPRRSQAAHKADLFVQIRPGTDGALALGLCHLLITSDKFDHKFVHEHSTGYEPFSEYIKKFTLDYVAQQTGVDQETIKKLSELIIVSRPQVVNFPGNSIEHNANGFNNIRAIACLTGLCGAVNVKGGELWTKPFPNRSLELHNELDLKNQQSVGADLYPLPYEFYKMGHSMTAIDHILGKSDYPLRGLIITGANPAITNPNASKVSEALSNLDLLVTRDLFMTATTRQAHYVLPAAMFLERSDLNSYESDQVVALSNKVLEVPGARNEYSFWHDLAHRLGFGDRYFPWIDEDDVNRWILEPSGISLETLKAHPEGIQYAPLDYGSALEQPFSTPSGKFEFYSDYLHKLGYPALPEYLPPAYLQDPDQSYPFILITGAKKDFLYHSRVIDFRKYRRISPEPECEINQIDAVRLGINNNDLIRIVSPLGTIELRSNVLEAKEILPGFLQITHGWDKANVNLLTDDRDLDPISGFPNTRTVAVQVHKV